MKNLIKLFIKTKAFLQGKESGYCRFCHEYVIYQSEAGSWANICEDCLD